MNTSNSDDKIVLPKLVERLIIDDANYVRFVKVLGGIWLVILIIGFINLAMI